MKCHAPPSFGVSMISEVPSNLDDIFTLLLMLVFYIFLEFSLISPCSSIWNSKVNLNG